VASTLVVVAILYFVVPVREDPAGGMVLRAAVTALLLAGLAAIVVIEVRHAIVDPEETVDGLVTALALVWVVFALAFYVLHLHRPSEIAGLETRVDALYFAVSTMLTVGYGDIHATGQVARGLVLVQMVFDVAFVATAGAVLNARFRSRAERVAVERASSRGRRQRRGRRSRGDRPEERPEDRPEDRAGDRTGDPAVSP
jgi:voltage-gated potassium channel